MQATRNRETGFRWWVISSLISLVYSLFRRYALAVSEDKALAAGRRLTHAIHDPMKSKRRGNYRRFYGDSDPERDEKLDAGYVDYMARLTTECIRDGIVDMEVFRARGEITGTENIDAALKLGKGVILLSGHVGNYYASHGLLSLSGYKVTSISEKLPIGSMERQINRLRKRFKVDSTFVDENAARTAIKTFRANGIFSILFEITIRKDKAVALRFGAGQLHFDLGPALLAVRYGVPVLPMSVRSDHPFRHHATIHPPLTPPEGKDDSEKALHFLETWRDWLEGEVKANPEQWWPWFIEDFFSSIPRTLDAK